MSTTERMLIGALFAILMGLEAWLLGTVSVNSARIAVLEQRTNNHSREMVDMKADMRDHRSATERR
jgi:hypothetical protein